MVQVSTRQTEYFMVFGRETTLPIVLVNLVKQKQCKNSNSLSSKKLKRAHNMATSQNQQANIRQERNHNSIKQNKYSVGSLVYHFNPLKGKADKERCYNWNDPFVITKFQTEYTSYK